MSTQDFVKKWAEDHGMSEKAAVEQITFLMCHMPRQQKGPAVTGPNENVVPEF